MNASTSAVLTRRRLLAALAVSAGFGSRPLRAAAAFSEPLSFQVHAIRTWLIDDFEGTLRSLREVGYRGVEMASFPGFRDSPRGDFGALANVPAKELARRIHAADLTCVGCHCLAAQFVSPASAADALHWVTALGSPRMILTALPEPTTVPAVQHLSEHVAAVSALTRRAGMRLVVHTDQALWGAVDGVPIVDRMMQQLDSEQCNFELDFGGLIAYRLDAVAQLTRHPQRFECMHIRDGHRPPDPTQYVPAVVPGEGVLDWPPILDAAVSAGVREFVVEMETKTPQALADCSRAFQALQQL